MPTLLPTNVPSTTVIVSKPTLKTPPDDSRKNCSESDSQEPTSAPAPHFLAYTHKTSRHGNGVCPLKIHGFGAGAKTQEALQISTAIQPE